MDGIVAPISRSQGFFEQSASIFEGFHCLAFFFLKQMKENSLQRERQIRSPATTIASTSTAFID
jgi:hypothetical protein